MGMTKKIRVLVVDDSALMRKVIPLILNNDADIEVVGTAMDGDFALKKISVLKPDVITLDMDMPRMDGMTALRNIVKDFKIPVILVSSLTQKGAEITLKGLEIGAFDFVPKPEGPISLRISEIAEDLTAKIKAAYCARLQLFKEPPHPKIRTKVSNVSSYRATGASRIVAIGISTGGPQALADILPQVPEDFHYAILIVQHMPYGFTNLFAERLDSICSIRVKEAADGDVVGPGMALIAPGGRHLKIKKTAMGVVSVTSSSPEVSGHRPSATVLFNSIAEEFNNRAVGIIMTGMGEDGVEGLRKIKENGGITIAQDEDTSVIYGMPKIAVERGYVDMVLRLEDIVPELVRLTKSNRDTLHLDKKESVLIPYNA